MVGGFLADISATKSIASRGLLWPALLFASFLAAYIPTFITLAQGPWQTEQEGHGPLIIAASAWLAWQSRDKLRNATLSPAPVLGWLVLIGVLTVSVIRKERIGLVWVTAAGYAAVCQVPIYLMRSSKLTALELAQTLRYLPDLVVVLALLLAVGLCAPNRVRSAWLDASRTRTVVTVCATTAFVACSRRRLR